MWNKKGKNTEKNKKIIQKQKFYLETIKTFTCTDLLFYTVEFLFTLFSSFLWLFSFVLIYCSVFLFVGLEIHHFQLFQRLYICCWVVWRKWLVQVNDILTILKLFFEFDEFCTMNAQKRILCSPKFGDES